MSTGQVVVQGHVRADGVLVIDQRVNLPAGPVTVTVEALSESDGREDTRPALEAIWAQRKALGLQPRTKAEIDAEIDVLRNQSEEEVREVERLLDKTPSNLE